MDSVIEVFDLVIVMVEVEEVSFLEIEFFELFDIGDFVEVVILSEEVFGDLIEMVFLNLIIVG